MVSLSPDPLPLTPLPGTLLLAAAQENSDCCGSSASSWWPLPFPFTGTGACALLITSSTVGPMPPASWCRVGRRRVTPCGALFRRPPAEPCMRLSVSHGSPVTHIQVLDLDDTDNSFGVTHLAYLPALRAGGVCRVESQEVG